LTIRTRARLTVGVHSIVAVGIGVAAGQIGRAVAAPIAVTLASRAIGRATRCTLGTFGTVSTFDAFSATRARIAVHSRFGG
jgi:hypothetical protein